jgi:hypothetical protein
MVGWPWQGFPIHQNFHHAANSLPLGCNRSMPELGHVLHSSKVCVAEFKGGVGRGLPGLHFRLHSRGAVMGTQQTASLTASATPLLSILSGTVMGTQGLQGPRWGSPMPLKGRKWGVNPHPCHACVYGTVLCIALTHHDDVLHDRMCTAHFSSQH